MRAFAPRASAAPLWGTGAGWDSRHGSPAPSGRANRGELSPRTPSASLPHPGSFLGASISRRPPGPTGPSPIQRTKYNQEAFRKSSKFRFIRNRRRQLLGRNKGVNFFTVKYKKAGKSYYLTTRSVPSTNAKSFNLATGHSEERFKLLRKEFQKKYQLKKAHLQYGATEREPCGVGSGMANCRGTLSTLGIPDNKIFFASPYPDRTDVVAPPNSSLSTRNQLASVERGKHAKTFAKDVDFIHGDADSDNESEDEADVVDEYEEDYGEKAPKFRKRFAKKLTGKAFRF